MHLIRIKTENLGLVYINLEDISLFYFDPSINKTNIETKNKKVFAISGDCTIKLSKIITVSTNGNTTTLE